MYLMITIIKRIMGNNSIRESRVKNKTSTDLQCSKTGCENYICPSCLEQTPVGARCPDCAQMKKNPLYDPSNKELVVSAFA